MNKIQLDGMHSPRNLFNSEILGDSATATGAMGANQEEHKIFLLAYVDYSKKYGLGYLINNNYYGVYFNDETLMSTSIEKKKVYFMENPANKQ